ncbi:MAG: histidinol dehydrogenase [Lentisphaerae bacterium]|jgi:histidinol dehydrogenase|nr:histidinol dehydrogenase [Lentisphaerota bacterium]MBT4817987.1 histidinol dehydrogenase [Lentisphaerota bacterium]MBT5605586.1 histidinol dehydrogenase [Lentisphaerota bacterium]MBT7054858.1 histidinol dehydrogenase [Lentisphaerota bacterium]MBT7841595.1 histidinol dehydrogenase [Lentisphaerota bacterium]
MEILRYSDSDFESRLSGLLGRTAFDAEVEAHVAGILSRVQNEGDAALTALSGEYDRFAVAPDRFQVTVEEIERATGAISSRTRKAIRTSCRQVRDFAAQRIPKPWSYSPRNGVILGERFAPFSRIGAYVPGGTAPLVSTVLHTVTLAAVAGVEEIVVITPPGPEGDVHPAILYAAQYAGATEIYRLGGVYGIGALAYGTESISRVEKIVGPGNAYVTAAKRQVYGYVSLDLVAGPSEIMIIADDTADPRFVAADMLSQAEHGSGREQAVLVTTSRELVETVQNELAAQSAKLRRAECVSQVLESGVFVIEVATLEEAADLASRYAPEHLEIMTRRAGQLAKRVTAAGAIFLGPWTPEPVGDFVAGPSHVLPTGGAARYFSGLTVEQFFRRMSVVNYQKSALARELPHVERFAATEGLDAHGRSGSIRFERT